MKVLVATIKPFASAAVDEIKKIIERAGYEFALLEKYSDHSEFIEAVKNGSVVTNDGEIGAKTVELVEATRKSLEQEKTIIL